MKTYSQELYKMYPIPQNNGARIIQSKIDRMQVKPSEQRGDEIESMSGLPYDWLDADYGEEKQIIK